MADPVIQVTNLGKRYRLGATLSHDTLRDHIASGVKRLLGRGRPENTADANEFWALRNVSLNVEQGEVLGVIGRNGAGKSTLLKILSQITEPTEGEVHIRGRVASLLEVGTGFHPELSGRENIYLNGAILGMTKREIDAKFDEIVAFAEVEKFMDTPVKRYSSGMYVRLAFAVAAHLEPEILLIDEVLAVGDAQFQRKCLGRMEEVAEGGRTVLFVSHNMTAIAGLCSRVAWIEHGRMKDEGATSRVTREYLASTRQESQSVPLIDRTDRQGPGRLRFTSFAIRNEQGPETNSVRTGDSIEFVLGYVTLGEWISNVKVQITLKDASDRILLVFWSELTGEDFERLPPRGELICAVPRFPVPPGKYFVNLGAAVNSRKQSDSGDVVFDAARFEVAPGDFYGTGQLPGGLNVLCYPHSWRLGSESP